MKKCRAVAIKTSKTPKHVLDTMFIKGELYIISNASNIDYYLVEGKFQNSLGGFSRKENTILKTECNEYLHKLHLCYTDNSSWLNSLEKAYIRIQSPTGRSIDISKIKMRVLTEAQRKLVWKAVGNEKECTKKLEVHYTKEELKLLLNISKL